TQGETSVAQACLEESLAIRRELGDRRGMAEALILLGNVSAFRADYATACGFHEEGLAIWREYGNTGEIAGALANLGHVSAAEGDDAAAQRLWEESAALRRSIGERRPREGDPEIFIRQGDLEAARALLEAKLKAYHAAGDRDRAWLQETLYLLAIVS